MARIEFLADENIPRSVVDFLRSRGHAVTWVRDALYEGADDDEVIRGAKGMRLVVLTKNKRHYVDAAWRSLAPGHLAHRTWGLVMYHREDSHAEALFREAIEIIEAEFAACAARRPNCLMLFVELETRSIVLHRRTENPEHGSPRVTAAPGTVQPTVARRGARSPKHTAPPPSSQRRLSEDGPHTGS